MKKGFVILCQFMLMILLSSCARVDIDPGFETTIVQGQLSEESGLSENEKANESMIPEGKDEIIASEVRSEKTEKKEPISDKTGIAEEEKLSSAPRYANVPEGTQYDLSALPKQADGCVGQISLATEQLDFEGLQKQLDPSSSVVFRGKVNGLSTQYKRTVNHKFYNETPLLVQEVYYGNLKAGDVVDCFEQVFVHLHDGEPILEYYGCCPPLEKDREYVFILHKTAPQRAGGTELYAPGHIYYPYFPVDEWETLNAKAERTWLEQRNYDVLSHYLK